jgi:hypothetical protein
MEYNQATKYLCIRLLDPGSSSATHTIGQRFCMSNTTNIHKDFFHCHKYSKQAQRFWSYCTCFRPEWCHLRTEADSFRKEVFVLKICDNGQSPCECWWYYSEGSAPQISNGTIWQNLKQITSPRILKTSFQKIRINIEPRLPPSKRFRLWNSVHNLCAYISYSGIIISSMVLFCHFSLEQGIIQYLLVMRCNQILSSLSPSDK